MAIAWTFVRQGILGVIIGVLLWFVLVQQDRAIGRLETAHVASANRQELQAAKIDIIDNRMSLANETMRAFTLRQESLLQQIIALQRLSCQFYAPDAASARECAKIGGQ